MKTIGQLKDGVAGLLQGTDLDNVTNINGALERAARLTIQRAAIPEASGRQNYSLYGGVIDYPAPVTIFGGSITDLRPQGISRTPLDYVYKQPIQQFDRTKAFLPNGYQLTFEYNKGTPIMRVVQTRTLPQVVLDQMYVTTGWVTGGSASALVEDDTIYYQAPSSLRFLLTGASSGYMEKTLPNPLNISKYEDIGVMFLAIQIPSTAALTDLTSIEMRIGSDSANYNAVTATQGFLGAFQVGNFLLVAFDLATSSQVGTPNFSAIKYVRATFTTANTIINMHVGGLFISLPSSHELLFESNAIFMNTLGVLSQTISGDNDTIILNDAAYTIYEMECAITIALQNGGSLSNGVIAGLNQDLNGIRSLRTGAVVQLGLYDYYRADNPSQVIRTVGNWYNDN